MTVQVVGVPIVWGVAASSSPDSNAVDAGTEDNRVLYACILGDGSIIPTITGITFNSVALTDLGVTPPSDQQIDVWRLIAPASGSNTLEVSYTGTGTFECYCFTYEDADQTTPNDTPVTASSGFSSVLNAAVTGGDTGDRKIAILNVNGDQSAGITADNTADDAGDTSGPLTLTVMLDGLAADGTSQSVGASGWTSQRAGLIAFNINQAAGGGGGSQVITRLAGPGGMVGPGGLVGPGLA